jgi:L-iditol 2-dehydrogenase
MAIHDIPTVTALVKERPVAGRVVLGNDWPRLVPSPQDVLIEVAARGLGGTDLHIGEDRHKNWPPVALGHEYVGRIMQVGNVIQDWTGGELVVWAQNTTHAGVATTADSALST